MRLEYPIFHATDKDGLPLEFGKLYSYLAGTSTPTALYRDAALSLPHEWPVELDDRGEAEIYFKGIVKLTLTDQFDVLIWTIDQIGGVTGSVPGGMITPLPTITLPCTAGSPLLIAPGAIPEGARVAGVLTRNVGIIGNSQGLTAYMVGGMGQESGWGTQDDLSDGATTSQDDFQRGDEPIAHQPEDVTITALNGPFDGSGSIEITIYVSYLTTQTGSGGGGLSGAGTAGFLTRWTTDNAIAAALGVAYEEPSGKVAIGVAIGAELLALGSGLQLGDALATTPGTLRYTGTDFEGRLGGSWVSLTAGGGGGGTPGGAPLQLQFNDGGVFGGIPVLTYDQVNNRIGVNRASPNGQWHEVSNGNGVNSTHILHHIQDVDYAFGATGAGVGLNTQSWYTGIRPNTPFTATHALLFGQTYYGLNTGSTTINTASEGTVSTSGFHMLVYGQADQESEYTALYCGMRGNIGVGYSTSGVNGVNLGQPTGPAGSFYAIADFSMQGPIGVQPGLLDNVVLYMNNFYNGSPSRSGQKSGTMWLLTGFGNGGELDGLHAVAQTYPIDVGIGICGTSGTASPGATRGYVTALQIGGQSGPWGTALVASLVGTGINIRDYDLHGIHLNNAAAGGNALAIAANAGNLAIGTTTFNAARKINLAFSIGATGGAGYYAAIDNAATAVGTTQAVFGVGTTSHSTGAQTLVAGGRFQGFGGHSGGTVGATVGVRAEAQHTGAGTSAILTAIYIPTNVRSAGVATTSAGLYMEDQEAVGNDNFSLYISGTSKNYFNGRIGIKTSNPSAVCAIDIVSTTLGIGLPSWTTTQKNAIAAIERLFGYDNTLKKLVFYNGTTWETVTSV